jgi:hypothetical protein
MFKMTCNHKKPLAKFALGVLDEEEGSELEIPLKLKEFLSENNACYVLITCGKPSKDGKMQVEMTYEGDASLAAYLIESAQEIIDDQSETLS